MTISHLRFGPKPIRAPYLINKAQFVACHQFSFLERFDMLRYAAPGGVFLLNSIYGPEEVWDHLPSEVQQRYHQEETEVLRDRCLRSCPEDRHGRAHQYHHADLLLRHQRRSAARQAIEEIKKSIKKTYGKRGEAVVQKNFDAVDHTLANLHEVKVPASVNQPGSSAARLLSADGARICARYARPDDDLRRRQRPGQRHADRWHLPHRHHPVGKTQYRPGNPGLGTRPVHPVRQMRLGLPARRHPHESIRARLCWPAPRRPLNRLDAKFKELPGTKYTLQVAPEDCTGCALCMEACPAKDKTQVGRKAINMAAPASPARDGARELGLLPDPARRRSLRCRRPPRSRTRSCSQPLFEFSGACAGCGETPYVKLLSQLFGDRTVIANATGCSSIYGGNLPTTPWAKNKEGRGPAWSNSLFEDNAEFGLGFRLTLDKQN